MTDSTPETPHFGLTRLGPGESPSKNGYSFSDLDKLTLDSVLFAAFNHRHDGVPALGPPTYPPSFVAIPTSGTLPAATTFYYRVSYVDAFGLETSAGPEGTVTTPAPVQPPTAAAITVLTIGGTVAPGAYSYLTTYTDSYGGETTPGAASVITVNTGSLNQIQLDLPDLLDTAVGYSIYRSRPGQSAFYLVGSTTSSPFVDNGIVEDQTVTAPTRNTTNSANAIQVTVPGPPGSPFIPLGCVSWKIYRATSSGLYDGISLVHNVVEGESSTSTTPVTMHTDTGDTLLQGFPQEVSSTPPPSPILNLADLPGGLPIGSTPRGSQTISAYCAGTPTNGQVISVTATPNGLTPVRLTAYFQSPPTTAVVTFTASDSSSNSFSLPCSTADHKGGDPTNYFHVEFPLLASGHFEAEAGTRSNPGTVNIQADTAASGGQTVKLNAQDEWVEAGLGILTPGTYHTTAVVMVPHSDTSLTDDLIIEVVNLTTSTTIASTSITLSDPTQTHYLVETGPTFVAPGTGNITLRVRKATTSSQVYLVDNMSYTAEIPALGTGIITLTAAISGGSTTASDVNLVLWF